jgi:hypothetical protein
MLRYDRVNAANYFTAPAPGTAALRAELSLHFNVGDAGIVRDRDRCAAGALSEHCEARAWDAKVRRLRDPEGWRLAYFVVAHAERFGVQSCIYDRMVWGFGEWRWHPYGGPNPHVDHVHIGQNWAGARTLTRAMIRAVLEPAPLGDEMRIVFAPNTADRFLLDPASGELRHIVDVETYRGYLDAGAVEKPISPARLAKMPRGKPIVPPA